MKIFLLEDDPIWQKIIRDDLEEAGHEVVCWSCVSGAAEAAVAGGFGLLVIDIILPYEEDAVGIECKDGGVRVLESLARQGVRLPTVFVSIEGYEGNRRRIEALGLGASMYFRKPYDEEAFLRALKRIESAATGRDSISYSEPEADSRKKTSAITEETGKGHWINAELNDHNANNPLQMGEAYALAFSIDKEPDNSAGWLAERGGAVLVGVDFFGSAARMITFTIHLSTDDFEIHSGPQKLLVSHSGKSKGKAFFNIEPKHVGDGKINALFLKEGNLIQRLKLKFHTVASAAGVLSAEQARSVADQTSALLVETEGRCLAVAYDAQSRDVTLTIEKAGNEFKIFFIAHVHATASLSITSHELSGMVSHMHKEFRDIVRFKAKNTHIYQVGIDIPKEVSLVTLGNMARAGYRLYQKIFYGPSADAQVRLMGDKLREMARKTKLRIQVSSRQFVVPWGLLYVADDYDPNNIDPEMFLGLKHIIEYIPFQSGIQVTDGIIDASHGLRIGFNVDPGIDGRMGLPLVHDQLAYWREKERGGGVQVAVRESREQLLRALADPNTPDQIFYLFCHAASRTLDEHGGPDASCFILGGEPLTLEELNLRGAPRQIMCGTPLVFINACESAELSPLFYDGFVPFFMSKGGRGVIGTKCEIPALFAAEWARRLFDRFLAGEHLGQIFLDLRREFYYKHNNLLGLFYAMYCNGDTRVVHGTEKNQRSLERTE